MTAFTTPNGRIRRGTTGGTAGTGPGGARTRRARVLAAASTLATTALIAGVVAVPSAGAAPAAAADAPTAAADRAQRDHRAEARGVRVAAARAAAEGIDWAACPGDWELPDPVQCGWVTVPVDYAEPNGDTVELAVDRAPATGGKGAHQGSLLYNPGGPGGSGMPFPLRSTTGSEVWKGLAEAYDFVGFDPRGVGRSAPLSCMDPQEFAKAPKPAPVPDDEADKRAHRKLARAYADGCVERSGDLLRHMNTPNTARDLDVIRAALGEKKLNYLGVSYGTYLGAVYAELFPGHVRRMVFDSVVNPSREKIWYRANLDQNVAFQTRWNDWTAWVAEHDDVYGIGTTAEQVQERFTALRAAVKKEPVGGVVGPAELLGFFQGATYSDRAWAPVAAVWSAYAEGDEQALVDAAGPDPSDTAGNVSSENGNAVYTAVECNDARWPSNWKRWDRDSTRLHRDHPFLTWSNTWMNLPCADWPLEQREPVEVRPGRKLPPTLILQAERDAATPYEGAVELHERLKGSRLVTERDAGSHGVSGLTNPCVNKRVDAYLLDGTLGKRDVTCAPHAEPQPESQAPAQAPDTATVSAP